MKLSPTSGCRAVARRPVVPRAETGQSGKRPQASTHERPRGTESCVFHAVFVFKDEQTANAFGEHLKESWLNLNLHKSGIVPFTAKAPVGVVPFLGFDFYWGRNANGERMLKLKTSWRADRSRLRTPFRSKPPTEEPDAGNPHIRFCEGPRSGYVPTEVYLMDPLNSGFVPLHLEHLLGRRSANLRSPEIRNAPGAAASTPPVGPCVAGDRYG